MSGPNFSFPCAHVPPTVSDRFLSNFQGVLSSPRCTTYHLFIFYIADLRSVGGHDLVMPMPMLMCKAYGKYSNSSNFEITIDNCFTQSLLCLNTLLCNDTCRCFSLLCVIFYARGQIRSTEVNC